MFTTCQLWGYFDDNELIGIIAFREGWIDQLYVLPSSQGQGVGTALLRVAQGLHDNLSLWTFQRNALVLPSERRPGARDRPGTDVGCRTTYERPNVFTRPNHKAPSSAPIGSLLIEAVLATAVCTSTSLSSGST